METVWGIYAAEQVETATVNVHPNQARNAFKPFHLQEFVQVRAQVLRWGNHAS